MKSTENKDENNCCCFLMAAIGITILVLLLPLIWAIISAIVIGIAAIIGLSALTAIFFPVFLVKVVLVGLLVYGVVQIFKILKK